MLPDRVSNPGPLTYESGALPIALRGPATNSLGAESRKKSYAKHFGYKLATGLRLKKNEF